MLFYGQRHCRFVILEGILKAEWYQPLFAFARELFGDQIYAWHFDLSFEEALHRHAGSDKAKEFGEAEMRRTCLFTRHPYLSVKKMPKGSGVILISTQKILKKQEKWPEIAENHQNPLIFSQLSGHHTYLFAKRPSICMCCFSFSRSARSAILS